MPMIRRIVRHAKRRQVLLVARFGAGAIPECVAGGRIGGVADFVSNGAAHIRPVGVLVRRAHRVTCARHPHVGDGFLVAST